MKQHRGFSLVEMVVVLGIMAILLGLGLTSYRTYMANQRVLSTAEVFMAGLQMARGEAVKLNRRVQFIMTNVDPTAANVDTSSTSTAGRNWIVRALPVSPATTNTFIEGRFGAEGSGAATSAGSPIAVAGSIAAITFDGFGGPVGLTATATFDFSNTTGTCKAPATANCTVAAGGGELRCPQVRLSRGGQARLCDPAVLISDTRNCCQ